MLVLVLRASQRDVCPISTMGWLWELLPQVTKPLRASVSASVQWGQWQYLLMSLGAIKVSVSINTQEGARPRGLAVGLLMVIPLHLVQRLACVPGARSYESKNRHGIKGMFSLTSRSPSWCLANLKTCPATGPEAAREFKTNTDGSEGSALTMELRSEFPRDSVEYQCRLLIYVLTSSPERLSPHQTDRQVITKDSSRSPCLLMHLRLQFRMFLIL